MILKVKALDHTGSQTVVATDSADEALRSLLAFETANFRDVVVVDDADRPLVLTELLALSRADRPDT